MSKKLFLVVKPCHLTPWIGSTQTLLSLKWQKNSPSTPSAFLYINNVLCIVNQQYKNKVLFPNWSVTITIAAFTAETFSRNASIQSRRFKTHWKQQQRRWSKVEWAKQTIVKVNVHCVVMVKPEKLDYSAENVRCTMYPVTECLYIYILSAASLVMLRHL